MPTLKEKLHALSVLSAELDASTDRLNERIEELEDRLSQCRAGVAAFITVPISEQEDRYLGYAKIGDKWKFVMANKPSVDANVMAPLLSMSRYTRMSAVPHLEAVVDALIDRTRQAVLEVKKTTLT